MDVQSRQTYLIAFSVFKKCNFKHDIHDSFIEITNMADLATTLLTYTMVNHKYCMLFANPGIKYETMIYDESTLFESFIYECFSSLTLKNKPYSFYKTTDELVKTKLKCIC